MRKLFTLTVALLLTRSLIAQDILSNTAGFSLNLNATAANWSTDSEFLGTLDEEEPNGAGVSLKAGYGVTQNIEVFVAYSIRTFMFNEEWDTYSNQTFDIGGRYNFGATLRRFRPFAEAALTFNAFTMDPIIFTNNPLNSFSTFKLEISGVGVSVGGGFNYFFTPKLSATLNGKAIFGSFGEVSLSGEEVTGLEGDLAFQLYVIQGGFSYFFQ